jgi:hypothetical protein
VVAIAAVVGAASLHPSSASAYDFALSVQVALREYAPDVIILPGPGDRYIVTDGPAKGMKGYFVRTPDGDVQSVHVGGRLATRVMEPTDDAR